MAAVDFSVKPKRIALAERLERTVDKAKNSPSLRVQGRVTRLVGLTLEAVGCAVPVGQQCLVELSHGQSVEAEVVGFSGDRTFLMPIGGLFGINSGARVIPINKIRQVPVGPGLLGRIIDGHGAPMDALGPLKVDDYRALYAQPINPLQRQSIQQPLDVGVRSINSLLTIGRGQRIGLFSGSGVGKSVLLGMMTKFTSADVIVVGLVGERGREVKEFIDLILGEEGLSRAVVVASPADDSPLLRIHAAMMATTIAEYFRDQGSHVLLLLDSLTRYAQAQREIALAVGEPPATRGYPASVFARIPQLVERAGNGAKGQGSITAIYTLLMEGDDHQEPIADAARAILDGHIMLSRQLADAGIYPAVDIESSISRVMPHIVSPQHLALAHQVKQLYATYEQNKDLVNVGAYQKGSNSKIDLALRQYPLIQHFLYQPLNESVNLEQSMQALECLLTDAE